MKPLAVLLAVFSLLLLGSYLVTGRGHAALAGNGAMAAMLLFTGAGHFAFTRGMMLMLPAFVPARKALVLLTGVLEIAAALALLVPALRPTTAWLLIGFFALILPANLHAARLGLNYQTATYDGPGLTYLWFRGPMQLFFMAWVWYFGIYLADSGLL